MFEHKSAMKLFTRASGLAEYRGVLEPFLIRVSENPQGTWFANLTVVGDLWKTYTCRVLLATDNHPTPDVALEQLNHAIRFLKENLNMPEKHWVIYNVLGKEHHAGPYPSHEIAKQHLDDIAGFEGVTNAAVTQQLPTEDRSRLDRLLEDDILKEGT